MNDVFFDYLNDFVLTYIDNILIYSNSKTKHIKHIKKTLQRLRNADLQTNINKCEFSIHETKYLKLIVERDEIKMNSFKVETILQWSISKNLKHVQECFEFCNFYKRFIKNFAKIIKLLIKLIKKTSHSCEMKHVKSRSNFLKQMIIKVFVLTHFDFIKQTYIENDSSNFVNVEVLS
jgi:hypothetical protein